MSLFDDILARRGISPEQRAVFLSPNYDERHNPFLLPDMKQAVKRLVTARKKQEKITIYGDYDIDGLTATTVLKDAFHSFGFSHVDTFMPNRFVEGYGLTMDAMDVIAKKGTQLIVTVDCGSLSHKEIAYAATLGMEVIVTDHHNVAPTPPPAVATINPKRRDHNYPFVDLAGVGVAFKLVQALQTVLEGIPAGQEKWLLDLVALGTVCDVVTLVDENRTNVYWGLNVLSKTRRPGLRALMAVADVRPESLTSRSLGFALGPRMNAAGRLETAQYALDLLNETDPMRALSLAKKLDEMNLERRRDQARIVKEAAILAEEYADDPVLVVSGKGWNHGIVGIVAANLLERYKKPTFVLEEMKNEAKGSARSYGDFSAADAIRAAEDLITKGGGHRLAAGVTLPTGNIDAFRQRVNELYRQQNLVNQPLLLLPKEDVQASIHEIDETLVEQISQLEPFGSGNPQPVLSSSQLVVKSIRKMGTESQHVKLRLEDESQRMIEMLAFSAPDHFFVEPGTRVNVWYIVDINEWQGRRTVEGRLLHLEASSD